MSIQFHLYLLDVELFDSFHLVHLIWRLNSFLWLGKKREKMKTKTFLCSHLFNLEMLPVLTNKPFDKSSVWSCIRFQFASFSSTTITHTTHLEIETAAALHSTQTQLKQNSFNFQTQSKYFHSDEQRNWFPTVVLPTHFKPKISIQWAHGKYLAIYLLILGFQEEDTGISLDSLGKHIYIQHSSLQMLLKNEDMLPIFYIFYFLIYVYKYLHWFLPASFPFVYELILIRNNNINETHF